MEETAAQNLPQAHAQLAEIYFFGLESADIKVDYTKAYTHALAAFQAGITFTLNMLGFMKENGYGTKLDLVEAEKYYRQAAMNGDFKAQINLGRLLCLFDLSDNFLSHVLVEITCDTKIAKNEPHVKFVS